MSELVPWLVAIIIVLLIATAFFAYNFVRYRKWLLRLRGRQGKFPIPSVSPDALDDLFTPDRLGPPPQSEVWFIPSLGVPAATSDLEAWILSVLAKRAKTLFEFGTASGRTAYLLARNSPDDATVTTLTLPPEQAHEYKPAVGDSAAARRSAVRESVYTHFRYTGTDAEAKIVQLFGDSKDFDEAPFAGKCDLIFVDGSHAYSYVESDTEKALRMLAPGGVILWHDYGGDPRTTDGVYRYLNGLHQRMPLVHLRGTTLAAYRSPST